MTAKKSDVTAWALSRSGSPAPDRLTPKDENAATSAKTRLFTFQSV